MVINLRLWSSFQVISKTAGMICAGEGRAASDGGSEAAPWRKWCLDKIWMSVPWMIVRSLFQAQGRAYAKALTWNLFIRGQGCGVKIRTLSWTYSFQVDHCHLMEISHMQLDILVLSSGKRLRLLGSLSLWMTFKSGRGEKIGPRNEWFLC